MKVKPEMMPDNFMGDFYLGCPNCKASIIFPFNKYGGTDRPNHCRRCGAEFDWSDQDERKE